MGTFLQAAVIIFREGLEALLIVAALTAYVSKTGSAAHVREIYTGVIAALISSFAIAWMFHSIFAEPHTAWAEGLLVLGAAILMLYVSGWLFVRRGAGAWQKYLTAKAEHALTQHAGYAIAAVAFLAVLREGIEVVVFVFALGSSGGESSNELAAGLFVGAVAILAVFAAVRTMAAKLPLKLIFVCTSALLFIMSIKFVGNAVQIFQESQYISATPVRGLGGLASLDLNLTWEAVAAQLAIVAMSMMTFAVFNRVYRAKMVA